MKQLIYSLLGAFTLFTLFSYSHGTFTADYTGSTGLGQSCAQTGCHTGGGGTVGVDSSRLAVRVFDAANIDVDTYTPGQQYTVEIKFKLLGATRVGFQCTNLFFFSNDPAGTISNTLMPTLVQLHTDGSGREYMSHTTAGNGAAVISGGYATWTYRWTAPATTPAAISFNCAVNRTNNSMSEFGDTIFIHVKTLQQPTSVENMVQQNTQLRLSPNPCFNRLHWQLTNDMHADEVIVYTLTGNPVLKSVKPQSQEFDVSALPTGNYLFQVKSGGSVATQLFSKF
jgi:hypothetical protein